jgi:G3E family GTPase
MDNSAAPAFGMYLLLFSGFLGSGKTSLVIPLAKAAAGSGHPTAVIVNEIGDIGIDNQLMRQLEINVWELIAGCICCTLSGNLVATLEKLDSQYSPHLVIIEASGAADPAKVLSALPYYRGRPLASVRTACVLDPLRLKMLTEVITPLITSQIAHADVIIIAKTDIATREEVDFARRTATDVKPDAHILISGKEGRLKTELVSELLPWPI